MPKAKPRRSATARRPLRTAPRAESPPRKRMGDELGRSRAALERAVQERTAELTGANEQLRREVAERKRAEAARDEFLSVAAHELKTPLTSLRGFSQVLLAQLERSETPDPERLAHALTAIDRQSDKLSRLVSQLLDISRLDAGQLALDRLDTDVMGLVRAVRDSLPTSPRGHEVTVQGPASAPALVDPLRLEQVLTNLLDNAIKFSPMGGTVEVAVACRDGTVEIAVTDRGIGIPREHRQRVFDRFHQAERRLGGMGLGLYISRQIVELHGGRLLAEHPREGGTRMVVRLPVGP